VNQNEEKAPGSEPLKQARYERYARYRARMFSITEAGALAGFPEGSGGCSRAEKRSDVRERIAWLTRGDEEIEREKRLEIEHFYWFALRADPAEFWKDGRLRSFDEMPAEYRQLVEGLTYTEKGKPNLKVVSKLAASIELRKLKGLDAPTKIAPTNTAGDGPAVIETIERVIVAPVDHG
jgi:hypothetical protein